MSESESILVKLDKIIELDNNGDAAKNTPDQERTDRRARVKRAERPSKLHKPTETGEKNIGLNHEDRERWPIIKNSRG